MAHTAFKEYYSWYVCYLHEGTASVAVLFK